MAEPHRHESHAEIIARLKRAEGHLRKVIGMVEEGRPCLDLAQQLQAVEKAVGNAKTTLIKDHLDHCLKGLAERMDEAQRKEINDFKEITRYL